MKENYQQLIFETSDVLCEFFFYTIRKKFTSQELHEIVGGNLLNLIMSVHLSSMASCLNIVTREEPEMNETIKNLLKKISDAIFSVLPEGSHIRTVNL